MMTSNSTPKTALATAVSLLAKSEKFESEVRQKLSEFEPAEVEAAISKLKSQNIINDHRTATSYLKSKEGRRGVGTRRLEYELLKKGASAEVVSALCQTHDDSKNALTLLSSKFRPDLEFKPRAFRFLLSRGFDFETARNVTQDYFATDV